jgi:hypothetical protein
MPKKMSFKERGGKYRASIPIWVHLTKGQVEVVRERAKAAGKTYRIYLRDIAEAAIEQIIPAEEE